MSFYSHFIHTFSLLYRGRGERLCPLIISIRLHRIQTSATGFGASIINTNQRVNCGPGLQVWSAHYTYAGPQVRILQTPATDVYRCHSQTLVPKK